MAKLTWGIVGVGPNRKWLEDGRTEGFGVARQHARALLDYGQQLVAACDINEEYLRDFAQVFSVSQIYTKYMDMLAQARPDIVIICTWPPLHSEMVVQAAEAGVKGILCEKPMALSMDEVRRMLEATRSRGVKLAVNHQRRFGPTFRWARDRIRTGTLGRVRAITAYIGGINADLLSWGTHWVDMMRFFLDDVPVTHVFAQAQATSGKKVYGHYVEDRSVTVLVFANGVRGLLYIDPEYEGANELHVVGDQGALVVNDREVVLHGREGEVRPELPQENALAHSLLDLAEAVESGREPYLSGEQGAKTTEILLAAYESSNRREQVPLPLDIRDFPLLRRLTAGQALT